MKTYGITSSLRHMRWSVANPDSRPLGHSYSSSSFHLTHPFIISWSYSAIIWLYFKSKSDNIFLSLMKLIWLLQEIHYLDKSSSEFHYFGNFVLSEYHLMPSFISLWFGIIHISGDFPIHHILWDDQFLLALAHEAFALWCTTGPRSLHYWIANLLN